MGGTWPLVQQDAFPRLQKRVHLAQQQVHPVAGARARKLAGAGLHASKRRRCKGAVPPIATAVTEGALQAAGAAPWGAPVATTLHPQKNSSQ